MSLITRFNTSMYKAYTLLANIIKNPYRAFFVFLIQPLCTLLLFTSLLKGWLTVPEFPAEEITRKVLVYGLAVIGLISSVIAKYGLYYIKSVYKTNSYLPEMSLANFFILLIRVVTIVAAIKLGNIQEFDKLYYPLMAIFMLQT